MENIYPLTVRTISSYELKRSLNKDTTHPLLEVLKEWIGEIIITQAAQYLKCLALEDS